MAPAPPDRGEPDELDAYEEGDEEPQKCVIKIEITAALNVWGSEAGEAKSKAGFTIAFPGEPADVAPAEMEGFLPDVPEESDDLTPPPKPLPPPLPNAPPPAEPPPPPPPPQPVNFTSIGPVVRQFERLPEYPLYHKFIHEPMIATVHWISPTGALKFPLATAKVDLTRVLDLTKNALELSCQLEAYVEAAPPPPPAGAKKGPPSKPPPAKKDDKKGAAPAAAAEVKPVLLEGASLKIKISTSIPLLSDEDRKEGFIMEISVVTVRKLPPKVKELGTSGTPDPFSYTCGFRLPGFSGAWWDSMTCFEAAEKASLSIYKSASGAVETEEVTFPKPIVIPEDKGAGPREYKKIIFGANDDEDNSVDRIEEKPVLDEYGYPPEPEMITEIHEIVKWKETVKRYLPSEGANEVRARIKKKERFGPGQIARYIKQESYDVFCDPFFARYRSSFEMDLLEFQEKEGTCSYAVPCPLGDFVAESEPVFCPPDERPASKKAKPVEDDSGPPPASPPAKKDPKAPVVETPPLPNAWKAAESQIFVTITTSLPIEPVWKPPPEPELKVENIIPPRPKAPNLHGTVKIAMEKFKEFVQIAAHDISSLHQSVVEGDEFQQPLGVEAVPATTKSRIESKQDIRRKVVQELHRSGAWQQMRDEMKSRVLKIASEKFRLGTKNAITTGKFEFCNALYVKLMEEVHACLADMFLKRHMAAMPLGTKDDKPLSEQEKKLLLLRQLADEYEYDGDYRTANKFHQDRLLGETIHNPDVWFEYGCFCMRTKEKGSPRDRGKAEECFREALTLDNRHLYSLLALACLMWHRGYLTQAEVLLRTAIELHPGEEFIPWCILSQIHQAQGQKEHVNSCVKKAELLYKSASENRNSYTTPHILLSPLLKFPFSVGYLFLRESCPYSTVFIDTSLLLLDLHLPKEGMQILGLECDVFSTAFDNKWAHAKAHELMKEYKKGEIWLKENLSITKEEPMSWLLLGRIRYVNKEFAPALEAYEKHLRYQQTKEVYPYVYLDIGNSHIQLKNYMAAKKFFLKVCSISPCTSSWLGAGISFFRICDFKHAEIALVEGNHMDSKNQKVWAYLTLTCLALDRCDEAEISFQQLQKVELTDVPLLLEIADGFAKFGNYRDAEAAVMDALREEDGRILGRFELADLHLQQGKLECAKMEYENILELEDITCTERMLAESKHTEIQAQILFANQPNSDRRVTI